MLATHQSHAKKQLVLTVVALLVIAGAVLLADHPKSLRTIGATVPTNTSSSPSTTTPSPTPSTTSPSTTTGSSSYKDGTYTASSDYYVPHGYESIQVNVTLQNGTITAASIKNSENDFTSASFQEEFASAYKSYVVGKKISGLQIGVIAGASDTTQGFNEALNQIATKAQA